MQPWEAGSKCNRIEAKKGTTKARQEEQQTLDQEVNMTENRLRTGKDSRG